jgi:hypothetical protein
MRRQHGHQGNVLSRAAAIRSCKVGMDDGTWHCVRWLHLMRQQLVKFRTLQINSLRGLLTEYGEVMGRAGPGRAESLSTSCVAIQRRRLTFPSSLT